MKVGDLVTVGPTFEGAYMIISLDGVDPHTAEPLPECVVLAVPEHGFTIAMHRRHLKMISEA